MLPWTGTGYGFSVRWQPLQTDCRIRMALLWMEPANVYIADTMSWRVVKETLSGGNYIQSTIGSGSVNRKAWQWMAAANVYLTNSALARL